MENSAVDDDRSTFIDGENRSKRLSILKPPKSRPPLKDVNFGESIDDTEDFETARRRRVSFAGVNSIKEFCSNAESLQVCHVQSYEETFSTSSDNSNSCVGKMLSSNNEPTGSDCNFADDPMDLTDSDAHVLELKTNSVPILAAVPLMSQMKQFLPVMDNAVTTDAHPTRKSGVTALEMFSQCSKTSIKYSDNSTCTNITMKTTEQTESKFHIAVPTELSMDTTEPLGWIKSSDNPNHGGRITNFHSVGRNSLIANLSDSEMEFTQALPQKVKNLPTRLLGEDMNNISMEITEPVDNPFKLVQSRRCSANERNMEDNEQKVNLLAYQNMSKTETSFSNGMELTEPIAKYPIDNVFPTQNVNESNLNNSTTPHSELIYQKGKSWNEKVGSSIGTSKDMEMTGVLSLSKCEKLLSKTKVTDDMEFTEILPTINDKNSGEETDCIQTLKVGASKCQATDGNDCPPVRSQARENIQEPETVDNYIPRIEFGNNRKPCSPVELSFLKEFNASCDTSKISGHTEDSCSIDEIVPVNAENAQYNGFKEFGRKSMKMFGESEIGEFRCINRSSQSDESVSAVIPRNPASFNDFVNRDIENSVTNVMHPDKSLHDSFILKGAPELTCTEEVPRLCYDFTEPLSSIKDSIAQQSEQEKLQFSTQNSNPVSSQTLGLASMDKTNNPQSRTVLDCEDMDTSITNCLYSNVPQFPMPNATNLYTSGNMELTEVLPTQHKICFPITPVSSGEEMRMNNTCEVKTSDKLLDNMDISMDETLMKGNTPIACNSAKINPMSSDSENVLQSLRNDKNNEICDTPKSSNLDRDSNIDLEMEHTAIADTHPSHARRSLTFPQEQEKVHDLEPNQYEKCRPRLTQNDSNAFYDQPTNSAIHNEDYASQNVRSPLSSITESRKSIFNGDDNANSGNMYSSNDTNYLSSKDNDFAQEGNEPHTYGCKKSIPVISSEMSPRDILQANDEVLDDTLITMRKSVAAKDQSSGCFIPSFTFPETQAETVKNIESPDVGHNDNETGSLMDVSSVSTNSGPISSEFMEQKDERSKFLASTVNCDGDLLHHSHSESVEEKNIHLQSVAIQSNDARESELCTGLEMNSESVVNSKSFGIRGLTRPSLIPVRSDVPDLYLSTLQRKSCVEITSATNSLEEETVEAEPSGGLINERSCQGSRKSCTGSLPNSKLSPEIPKVSLRESFIGFDPEADGTSELDGVNCKHGKSIFIQNDVLEDELPVELCTPQETCQNVIFKTSGRKSCVGVDLTSDDNVLCEATNSNNMPEAEQSKPRKSVFQPAVEDILENEIVGTTPVVEALNEHTPQETLSTRTSCVGSGVNSSSSSNVLTISGRKSCVGTELISNDKFLGAVESGNIMNEVESRKTRSSIFLGATQDALREEDDVDTVETTKKSCVGSAVSANPNTAIVNISERKSVGYALTDGVDSSSTKDDSFPKQSRAPRKSAFLGPFVNELDIDPLISEPSLPDRMYCHGLSTEQTYDTKFSSTKTTAEDSPNDHEDLMNISNNVDDTDDRMHISSTPLKLNDTGISACSRKRSHSRRKSLRPVISCEDLANELSQDLMNVSLQSETKSPLPKKMSIEIVEVPDVVASRVMNSIDLFEKIEGMGESTVSLFDGLSYETRVKNSNFLKSFGFRSMGRRTWKTAFINGTFGVIIILPACQFTEHTQIESVRYSFHPEKIGKTCLLDIDIMKFLKWNITEEYSEYWLKQNCTRIGDLRAVVDRLNSKINFLRPTAEKLILMKLIHPCKINRNRLSFTIISAKEIRKFEVTIDINFPRTVDSSVFVTNLVGEVDESCVQLVFRSISPDKDMFHKFVHKLYEMLPRLCV